MNSENTDYIILPLLGEVIFPYEEKEILVEEKLWKIISEEISNYDNHLLAVCRKSPYKESLSEDSLKRIGTIIELRYSIPVKYGFVSPKQKRIFFAKGIKRAEVENVYKDKSIAKASIKDVNEKYLNDIKVDAIRDNLLRRFVDYSEQSSLLEDYEKHLVISNDPSIIADLVGWKLLYDHEEKQKHLETLDVYKRLENSATILEKSISIKEFGEKIKKNVKDSLDKKERIYYLRAQMKAIQKELGISSETGLEEESTLNPVFRSRVSRIDKKLCFVLMPFSENWSDRIYFQLIRPMIENLGLQCLRADNLTGQIIIEDIWIKINQSAFIIADVTKRNPNVMYELGIAHTIGKPVLLITQEINDIPFDFNYLRHFEYEDNTDGFKRLNETLPAAIKQIYKDYYYEEIR